MQLHAQHLEELVNGSGINLHIANLNFQTLEDEKVYEYLLVSESIPRTNTGMIKGGWLQRYTHTTRGGWWCSGVDPLAEFQEMEWGCFKPNQPRLNEKGKIIKYEHPPITATRVFCLRVTWEIWSQVSERYNVSLPEDIIKPPRTPDDHVEGFWRWVMQHNIPLVICEGVKKAATLLSHGYAAIAIPGINSGYRVTKDDRGRTIARQLISDLAAFTITKRSIYICFDFETESKKVSAVSNAISQLGLLFQEKDCPVQVIELPGLEKGVDEFIVAKGVANFEKIYSQSIDLEIYFAKTKPHNSLTIPPRITLNRRYLGKIDLPTDGLVGVKSAKGTGKTSSLKETVEQAKNSDRPILLITHRIQLGKFLCEQIGINWGIAGKYQLLNYRYVGLCIDSIWKLDPQDWKGAVVILDEVEQSIWHLLHSSTCKDKRVKVLKYFGELISTVLTTGGLVIAQDADLSDISLEYLQTLVGNRSGNRPGNQLQPWVIVNEWKPENGWDVTFYDSPNPTSLIQQLELDLMAGRKCYITTDSRSGRYSCETVERYLKERFAKLHAQFPKSLVISSQTTNTPGHEAVDFVGKINHKIKDYDAVFVTPSLGTGVSIDVEHFDRVYGIFQGVIPDSEARQALARVRDDIPRIVWCAKRGIGLVGSGSGNYRLLSEWYQENQKENLALLSPLHKIDVDLPLAYDPIHLRTWAKLCARVNTSICIYRQSMKEGLIAEGHKVIVRSNDSYSNIIRDLRQAFLATESSELETRKRLITQIVEVRKDWEKSKQKNKEINRKIRKIKQQKQLDTANAVANAENIDYVEYEKLSNKHSLTEAERCQTNKYLLRQRYGTKVTPKLKLKDDKGYYVQLLIHYYLTHESEFFRNRDKEELKKQLFRGEGEVFLPDLKTYTLKVEALRALGMVQFLDPGRTFQENDADLILLKNTTIQCSQHIKRALGISLSVQKEKVSAIKILNKLMSLLGLKLKRCSQNFNSQNCNSHTYQIDFDSLNDGRDKIFQVWQQRDELMLENFRQVDVSKILI